MAVTALYTDPDSEVLSRIEGELGWITLNRPKALNSLSYNMIELLTDILLAWRDDKAIKAVVIEGVSERAFCAGGDIKAVFEAKHQDKMDLAYDFFRKEYALNTLIHEYPKPYLAFLDGIAMGGGLGVSVHGSHRIVTDRSVLSMPETGIGFFPDVGGTWFLNQCPDHIGLFLAMTGHRFEGADALYAGIATHYVPSDRLGQVKEALKSGRPFDEVFEMFGTRPEKGYLEKHSAEISYHFDRPTAAEIVESFDFSTTELSLSTIKMLRSKSPLSICVAFEQITGAKEGMTFRQMMEREFIISQHFLRGHDFFEGVRALLVDKDQNPRWMPKTIEDVRDEDVKVYFQPTSISGLTFID